MVWNDDERLSITAREALANETNTVFVSAATAWEIATKQRLGKLPVFPLPAGGFAELINVDGFEHLPVTAAHAWRAGTLTTTHRDPFDRMLAAQAQLDALRLVTRDGAFTDLAIQTLW